MNCIPKLLQPFGNGSQRHGKTGNIPVQDKQARACHQQSDVPAAHVEPVGFGKVTAQIDRGRIERLAVLERKEGRRQHAFDLRKKVEILGVARQIEVGTTGVIVRKGEAQRGHIGIHRRRPSFYRLRHTIRASDVFVIGELRGF